MTEQEQKLNAFLVQVFGDILRLEDASLRDSCNNLSVSELHVIEAVENCQKEGYASMAKVANALGVTKGTLTAAVKTLEQKGYLQRSKGEKDKRTVKVTTTLLAVPIIENHKQFHTNLIQRVVADLSVMELDVLVAALSGLHEHFENMKNK